MREEPPPLYFHCHACHAVTLTPQNTEPRHTKRSALPRIPSASASRGAARYFPLILTSSAEYAIFAVNNQNTTHYGNIQQQLHLGQDPQHPHHHPDGNRHHVWHYFVHVGPPLRPPVSGGQRKRKTESHFPHKKQKQSPARVRSKSSSPFLHFGWCKGLQGKKINYNGGTGKVKL